MDKRIIVYEPNERMKMEDKTDGETVWLTQDQMCRLFGRERSVITKHIRNIFKEGELDEEMVCAKFAHTTQHGAIAGKTQTGVVTAYNLDVVISVGYRVKSIEGTRFRQWATHVLREMLLKRVEDVREIAKLKRRMAVAEDDIRQIKGGMNYLVKQLSGPDTPRRKIGFGAKPGETSDTPYGRAK